MCQFINTLGLNDIDIKCDITTSQAVNVQTLQPEIAICNYQNTAYSTDMQHDNDGKW